MSLAEGATGGRFLRVMVSLPPNSMHRTVFLLTACSLACASAQSDNTRPVATAARPVEFESTRGAYSYEFVTEHVVAFDTVQVAPATAWAVIHRAYNDLGLPQGEAREGTTTYGVPRASVRRSLGGSPLSRFLRCGTIMGTPNADTYDVTLSLITKLVPLPPSATVVQSQLVATARQSGVASNPLPCTSTRELERRVARLLEYHAANR